MSNSDSELQIASAALEKSCCGSTCRRFRLWQYVVAILVGLPILFYVCGIVWQKWLGPRVDEELTRAVEISEVAGGSTVGVNTLPGILAPLSQEAINASPHALDLVLKIADDALEYFRKNVVDYRCVMMSEILMDNGEMRTAQYMYCKIRQDQVKDGKPIPFAVYGKFLKPQELLGQEVIWIKGKNGGKLVAHPAGLFNLKRFWLEPTSSLAMSGNRYPITDIGLENLLSLMAQRGNRDRKHGPCEVRLDPKLKFGERDCALLEINHPKKEGPYDFHLAKIYIDIERQILLGYEGFGWPTSSGGELPLIERFYYSDVELNVGLTDQDFNPDNPEYNYPWGK